MNNIVNYPGGPNVPAQARNFGQMIANLGPQSQLATTSKVDPNSLAAGIRPSFASVTFKGKTWGIRYRGVTHQLLARDPQTGAVLGAIPTIDVVILKSATAISKAFYLEKYKEGDFNQPDCWSTNGQMPDPAASKKQNETCRGCRWDAFGSRTMDDGRKGKACSDNKRVAVVPAADLKNEMYGGPMLLKLPPSAFNELSELQAQLLHQGYHYFAVIMRLSFDYQAAFPKIQFTPIGVLNDHQMTEVIALQDDPTVERILSEELFEVTADPNQPTPEAQQVQPTPPVQPMSAPIAQPAAYPTQQAPQAFSPSAPVVQPPQDNLAIPAHLQGPAPGNPFVTGTPPQATQSPQVTAPQAPQAAVQQPSQQVVPQTPAAQPCPPGVDPAQWAAFLAMQQGQQVPAKPKRTNAKRSNPVTPTGPQPGGGPALPSNGVAATQPNGAEPIADDGEGDAPPDLDARVDSLLGGGNPT